MKKVIYTLTLLIGISMTIQAQNTSVATDSVINILEGEWLWTSSTGGFCGCTIKGDKSRKYVFKKHPTSTDSINYDYLINEKVQSSGSSKVTYTSEKINNKSGWFLENLMNGKANILFSNSNNMISIDYPQIADIQIESFERSKVTSLNSQIISKEVKIYPNLVKNELIISGTVTNGKITIFNMNGNVAITVPTNSEIIKIDMSVLANGVYIVNVIDDLEVIIKNERIVVVY